ncbi:hypothetical protein FHS23_001215 [Prauserella isguenensis]|uniref:Uncharacterized protein n=1 Tax=Prauserella isguenensis TaxID=1470180 RepID=A0A839RZH1_9PSEU|nr:hypothetical protein [Prauserella isguenensis]
MSTRTPDTLQTAADDATAGADQHAAPEAAAEAVATGAGESAATDTVHDGAASAAAEPAAQADAVDVEGVSVDVEVADDDADVAADGPGGLDGAAREPRPVPVDFPVYGLHPRIPGPRWVDFFEGGSGGPAAPDADAGVVAELGEAGQSPWALWLGQRLADTERGLRIGSMPRLRYERAMCPSGGDPLAEVAFGAAFGLVNLTLPDSSVPRPDGLIESLLAHAEQHARRYEKWKRVTWRVDGMSVRARIWEFAGGWTGFTGDLDDSYVAVIGIGVAAEGLSLARVTDPKAYGVDFSVPISLADLGKHRATRPEAWLPPPRRDAFHAEQLALLPEDRTTAQ